MNGFCWFLLEYNVGALIKHIKLFCRFSFGFVLKSGGGTLIMWLTVVLIGGNSISLTHINIVCVRLKQLRDN